MIITSFWTHSFLIKNPTVVSVEMSQLQKHWVKVGLHTCVRRTNAQKQTRPMHQKPACLQQSHKRWAFSRGCEACASLRCACILWKQRMQYTEKSNTKEKFYKIDFRKIVIFYLLLDERSDLHTFKYKRPLNKFDDACLCGYLQNEKKLARANTSNLLKALKHLMETRLYIYIPKTKWACQGKKYYMTNWF